MPAAAGDGLLGEPVAPGGGGGGGSGGGEDAGRPAAACEGSFLPAWVSGVPRERLRDFQHHKRVGNYLIGSRKLGEGSFAKVREGLHVLTGEKVRSPGLESVEGWGASLRVPGLCGRGAAGTVRVSFPSPRWGSGRQVLPPKPARVTFFGSPAGRRLARLGAGTGDAAPLAGRGSRSVAGDGTWVGVGVGPLAGEPDFGTA